MKKKRQILLLVICGILLFAALTSGIWFWYDNNVDRSGWVEKNGIRFYRDFHADPVSGWLDLEDGRYYFHDDGTPCLGWQDIDGKTYYFGGSGTLVTGWLTREGKTYYLAEDGHRFSGWLTLDGKTHYFDDAGVMAEGWTQLAGGRYYLPGGTLATGWQDIDGKRYHFSSDGLMSIGFVKLESNRYYFDEDGAMVTGAAVIEDRRYLFQEDGAMYTGWEDTERGRRYYLPDGPMAVGWAEIDGSLYYFQENGTPGTGWLQLGEYRYYLHSDGTAAVGPTKIDGRTHYFSPKGVEVILVNALNPVPEDYEKNLVNVVGYHDVDQRCYDALVRMLADCNAAGIEYNFNSAYRTVEEQTAILEKRTLEHMEEFDLEFEEAREKALETVAIPGTSEHHLGLAVDLLGEKAIAWLQEHCWDYGFILRYTEEKESITGIVDEPWHFRYVGTEVSLDIKDSGLCLEEYLGAEPVTWEKVKALYGDKLYEQSEPEQTQSPAA